jgi:cobalt-zinc-cadmium efflux system outer membrane protein
MKRFVVSLMTLLFATSSMAQTKSAVDSTVEVSLNFEDVKRMLLKANITLLSSYYDVEAADAELTQAKLWGNPNFVWNQDLYSIEQNRYLNLANQKLLQVEYTFKIAGKYTNTVKLARLGVELSKLQVQDVMRSLLYDAGEHFYALQAAQLKQELYESTLLRYEQLIISAEERLRVGAMASNEVLRLKSEQIAVKTESTQNKNEVLEEMSQLRMLLNLRENVVIKTSNEEPPVGDASALYLLMDEALKGRPDYLLAEKQVAYQNRNLKLERSNAYPDLDFGYQPHDRGSNYVRPYQGFEVEFNVPLFNRNQGNIKLAKTRITQAELNTLQSENRVRNEVHKSYEQFINTRQGYQDYSVDFIHQTEELNTNATDNYSKKNINLLEFIDLQRIYIINKTQYIDLKNAYQRSINQLNFSIGKEIIH